MAKRSDCEASHSARGHPPLLEGERAIEDHPFEKVQRWLDEQCLRKDQVTEEDSEETFNYQYSWLRNPRIQIINLQDRPSRLGNSKLALPGLIDRRCYDRVNSRGRALTRTGTQTSSKTTHRNNTLTPTSMPSSSTWNPSRESGPRNYLAPRHSSRGGSDDDWGNLSNTNINNVQFVLAGKPFPTKRNSSLRPGTTGRRTAPPGVDRKRDVQTPDFYPDPLLTQLALPQKRGVTPYMYSGAVRANYPCVGILQGVRCSTFSRNTTRTPQLSDTPTHIRERTLRYPFISTTKY